MLTAPGLAFAVCLPSLKHIEVSLVITRLSCKSAVGSLPLPKHPVTPSLLRALLAGGCKDAEAHLNADRHVHQHFTSLCQRQLARGVFLQGPKLEQVLLGAS